jgi:hypothetical protein
MTLPISFTLQSFEERRDALVPLVKHHREVTDIDRVALLDVLAE